MAFESADDDERQTRRWLAIIAVVIPVCTFVLIAGWFIRAFIIPPTVSVQVAADRPLPAITAAAPAAIKAVPALIGTSWPSALTPLRTAEPIEPAAPATLAGAERAAPAIPVEVYRAPVASTMQQAWKEPDGPAGAATTASGDSFEPSSSRSTMAEASATASRSAAVPSSTYVTASLSAQSNSAIETPATLAPTQEPVPLPRARQPYHASGLVTGPIPLPRAKPGDVSPTAAAPDVAYDRHTVN